MKYSPPPRTCGRDQCSVCRGWRWIPGLLLHWWQFWPYDISNKKKCVDLQSVPWRTPPLFFFPSSSQTRRSIGALLNAQTLHAIDPSQLNVFFHTLILANAMLMDLFCKTIERSQNKIWRYKRIEANPTYFIIIRNVIPLQSPRHVRPHSVLLLAWPLLSTPDRWPWDIWPVTTLGEPN